MLRRQIFGLLITFLVAIPASGYSPQSMKGYELYSWKQDGTWYYSLLPATNRVKSYDEITSAAVARKGAKAIKKELEKLPKGEQVFWKSGLNPAASKPSGDNAPLVKLPSGKKVEKIKNYCDKLGLKLKMT